MPFLASRYYGLFALLAALSGCKPEIGDDCSVSTDCSNAGDRLCDTTQPGGYCTIFNCEPGTCPEESACISFKITASKACPDPQTGGRLRRTFCMRNCSNDSDCRGGYRCIDMRADNPWGAKVAEGSAKSGKVCVVPYSGASVPDAGTAVCEPSGPCGPDTCAGCCDSLGLCRAGGEGTACGSAGGACAPCSGSCVPAVGNAGGACESVGDAGAEAEASTDATTDAPSDSGDGGDAQSEGGTEAGVDGG